jgi:hypothetical protein
MLARQSSVIAAFKDGLNILFIQEGRHDLLSIDPSVWLTNFSAYLATFRAAIAPSGKLVRLGVSTHNPRNDTTFNAHRAVADAALRPFPREGKCDFVVDWAVDPTWGPDSAATNQTLYPDGTHASQAGQNNMEANYFRPALNSFVIPLTSLSLEGLVNLAANQSKDGHHWEKWMLGSAKNSPRTRGVLDVEERAERLRKFEKWGGLTPVSEDDLRLVVGSERWEVYRQRLEEIKRLMMSAQEEADIMRKVLELRFGGTSLAA